MDNKYISDAEGVEQPALGVHPFQGRNYFFQVSQGSASGFTLGFIICRSWRQESLTKGDYDGPEDFTPSKLLPIP